MEKRNILILMPAMLGGGAERILINVLGRIDFSLFRIDLVLGVKKGELLNQVPEQVNIIPIFNNQVVFRVVTWLQKRLYFNFLQKVIFSKKIKGNYDLGLSYLDGNMTDYLFHSKKIGKRVSWVHSSYQSNENFARFYKSEKYVDYLINNRYAKLNKICFVSNDCKEEFEQIFGDYANMEVIYNLINTKEVLLKSMEQDQKMVANDEFTFIAIGSLIPVKGYEMLIEAVRLLRDKKHRFKLKIVGKGYQKEYLKTLVNQNGLNEVVEFTGFTINPYPILKNADAFVMTSISEANPTSLCEALVLGKASIVVDVPGCREIIGYGEYGVLVERNANAVSEGMEKILLNDKLKTEYEIKAKERARDFEDEAIIKKYFEILNL